jgi:DinB family protein
MSPAPDAGNGTHTSRPEGSLARHRPAPDEYAPYYERYIARVPESSGLDALAAQHAEMMPPLSALPESQGDRRYAPGKWSVRQVLGHLADAERVLAYRALRFARGDATPLAGFDEDAFVAGADFDRQPLAALLEDLDLVRRSTITLFQGLDDGAWGRRGIANDVTFSVRALAFAIAGHCRHHMALLGERYFPDGWPAGSRSTG